MYKKDWKTCQGGTLRALRAVLRKNMHGSEMLL